MKMTKRVINVAVFTLVALIAITAFGYTFKMFREINAMDLVNMPEDRTITTETIAAEEDSNTSSLSF